MSGWQKPLFGVGSVGDVYMHRTIYVWRIKLAGSLGVHCRSVLRRFGASAMKA